MSQWFDAVEQWELDSPFANDEIEWDRIPTTSAGARSASPRDPVSNEYRQMLNQTGWLTELEQECEEVRDDQAFLGEYISGDSADSVGAVTRRHEHVSPVPIDEWNGADEDEYIADETVDQASNMRINDEQLVQHVSAEPDDEHEAWSELESGEDGDSMTEAYLPRLDEASELYHDKYEAEWAEGLVTRRRSPRDFKLELELSYGLEKAIAGAPGGFPFISDSLEDDTVVTTHRKSVDGFEVVMDGPRMEIETRRISLEDPAELDRIVSNIVQFAKALTDACRSTRPRTVPATPRAGKVRDFHLPVFADPDFRAFPIKNSRKQSTWFRQSCGIGASPQCTIDVPLGSVLDFVDRIRQSQSRSNARRWTGRSSSRAGLRSDALYHARDKVIRSFKTHSAAGRATNTQLTRPLAGFLILLVQYLRTSELRYHKRDRPEDTGFDIPDRGSRDFEQFPKAYVPLVVHTHFHIIFSRLLTGSEQSLFMRLYGNPGVRQNLYNLALDRRGSKNGSAELFPARTRGIQVRDFGAVLTWDQFIESAIDASKPIKDISGNVSLPTPLASASRGVARTGPIAAPVDGVRLEMRRMGYRWWGPAEWKGMSRSLYQLARQLNAIT